MSAPKKSRPSKQLAPLQKHKSWSPDSYRDELWLKRKQQSRSKSLTDEDFDDLKACFELGFGFDSPDSISNSRLSHTLPALGFYFAVNKSYNETILKSNKSATSSSSSENDLSVSSLGGNPLTIISPGDDPKTIKTRLRHWAQVVACSVKHP
ncbi:Protein phosphatase 1 regulatory subunit 42 [Bienertia sinuspersici]